MSESIEEIEKIISEELGRAKHKVDISKTLAFELFGKRFSDLTKEERKEYDAELYKRHKKDNPDYLKHKKEYEKQRYAKKREELLAKAKERYKNKKEIIK